MNNRLEDILTKIRLLERELIEEAQKKQQEFFYEVRDKKIRFQDKVRREHRRLVKHIPRYIIEAKPLNILTSPVIWLCLPPIIIY